MYTPSRVRKIKWIFNYNYLIHEIIL